MTNERLFVRCILTLVCLATSLVFFPFLIVLKIGEGAQLAFNTTADSIRQVWASSGIPELDKEQPRGSQD